MASLYHNHYGKKKGKWELPGATLITRPNGRQEITRPYATLEDPNRHRVREGTRDRRYPLLRACDQQITHNRDSISKIMVRFVDKLTYEETKANRYPRGQISVDTILQSGSITLLLYQGAEPTLVNVPVVYLSGTKTFVSYNGLDAAQQRAAMAAPFQPPAADIVFIDWSALMLYPRLVPTIKQLMPLRIATRWVKTESGQEAGGYWRRTVTWQAIQVPEIITIRGTIDAT